MDIICKKHSCKYNEDYRCNAKKICVDKKIICETFEKDPLKNIDEKKQTSVFDEIPPKYASHRETKVGCIGCKTNCLFNDHGICESNGITINNLSGKPFCVSYLKK